MGDAVSTTHHHGSDAAAVALLGLSGGLLGWLAVSGEYRLYLRPAMIWTIAPAAVFLIGLSIWKVVTATRSRPAITPISEAVDEGRHEADRHSISLPWLLLVPCVIIAVVGPTSLGSFGVPAAPPPAPEVPAGGYLPLPAGDPLAIPIQVYVDRASFGGAATVQGRRFTIIGFVSPTDHNTWSLTRLLIRCCVADALPVQVRAVGAAAQKPDQWVQVTGSYLPSEIDHTARLQVEKVEPVPQPKDPYVY
jgi:uncharacterized repeat protein (TIGR03943 family)